MICLKLGDILSCEFIAYIKKEREIKQGKSL